MKKLLFICLVLMGIVSCTDQGAPQVAQNGQEAVELSVMVPDAQLHSRALTERPAPFTNLYLAVFDEAGYLMEYRQAVPNEANENEKLYGYTVSLTPSPSPVTIHFIANAPTTLNFGSETEVMSQLYTTAGGDAYWQRVEFPEGLDPSATSVKNKLIEVRLIRNFAWIQLVLKNTITSDKFTLEKYCVVNTYDRGSMAPYNTSTGSFEGYPIETKHANLVSNGYDGFIPQGAELDKTIPDEDTKWVAAGNGFFIYERETPRTDPLFILMKGKYNGAANSSYYKIDLRDNSNNYFPVLRNFKYQVEIQNIEHEGHATALAAAQGAGSGDVSTSIETADYTNISNSIARIFVSYTDTTLVTSDPITLKYKFQSFDAKDQNNNTIPGSILNGDANVEITLETVGEDKKVIQTCSKKLKDGALVVDKDGWSTIEIQPVEPDGTTRVQKLTIVGTVMINGKTYTLQRQVKFNLKKRDSFRLECNPDAVPNTQGSYFDLVIKIPGGLGDAIFPLDFDIEAEAQSITPAQGDNLPVVTRESIVSDKAGKTTIGFMKSVSWEEYDGTDNVGGYKSIPCHFKTNKAESATVIWAHNKYFSEASATLSNYEPKRFEYLAFSKKSVNPAVDPAVTFTFNMAKLPDLGNVKVTLVGLVPDADDKLISLGGNTYSYSPSTTGEQTFYLKTTIDSGQASVTLEAYQFATEKSDNLNVSNKYIIPAGKIDTGKNNTTYYIFASDPGTQNNNNGSIANFSTSYNSTLNASQIEIEAGAVSELTDGYVYIRYSVTTGYRPQTTTYYVAKVLLTELMQDGGCNIRDKFQQK